MLPYFPNIYVLYQGAVFRTLSVREFGRTRLYTILAYYDGEVKQDIPEYELDHLAIVHHIRRYFPIIKDKPCKIGQIVYVPDQARKIVDIAIVRHLDKPTIVYRMEDDCLFTHGHIAGIVRDWTVTTIGLEWNFQW